MKSFFIIFLIHLSALLCCGQSSYLYHSLSEDTGSQYGSHSDPIFNTLKDPKFSQATAAPIASVLERVKTLMRANAAIETLRIMIPIDNGKSRLIDFLIPANASFVKDSQAVNNMGTVYGLFINDLVKDSLSIYEEIDLCFFSPLRGDSTRMRFLIGRLHNLKNKEKYSPEAKLDLFKSTASYKLDYQLDYKNARLLANVTYNPDWGVSFSQQKIAEVCEAFLSLACTYFLRGTKAIKDIDFFCTYKGELRYSRKTNVRQYLLNHQPVFDAQSPRMDTLPFHFH